MMVLSWFRRRRRRRIVAGPFPSPWRTVLHRNVHHWRLLSDEERRRLEDDLRIFIAEKYWEGCGGLDLTDEIRITIAAQACLLLLGFERHEYHPNVSTILVYPSGYFAPSSGVGPGGIVSEGAQAVLGQAHSIRGPVILSWRHVLAGGRGGADAHNVVLHEFAHKLDMSDGLVDGTPALRDAEQHREWVEVMTREYEALRAGTADWGPPLLRDYGATNPGEFFAVATEVFFERPTALRDRHGDLYRVLRGFFRQDPAARLERASSAAQRSTVQ